ncbi:MAG: hypothetical protein WA510_17945 [Acidobacteriaceae bacterium]
MIEITAHKQNRPQRRSNRSYLGERAGSGPGKGIENSTFAVALLHLHNKVRDAIKIKVENRWKADDAVQDSAMAG